MTTHENPPRTVAGVDDGGALYCMECAVGRRLIPTPPGVILVSASTGRCRGCGASFPSPLTPTVKDVA